MSDAVALRTIEMKDDDFTDEAKELLSQMGTLASAKALCRLIKEKVPGYEKLPRALTNLNNRDAASEEIAVE